MGRTTRIIPQTVICSTPVGHYCGPRDTLHQLPPPGRRTLSPSPGLRRAASSRTPAFGSEARLDPARRSQARRGEGRGEGLTLLCSRRNPTAYAMRGAAARRRRIPNCSSISGNNRAVPVALQDAAGHQQGGRLQPERCVQIDADAGSGGRVQGRGLSVEGKSFSQKPAGGESSPAPGRAPADRLSSRD